MMKLFIKFVLVNFLFLSSAYSHTGHKHKKSSDQCQQHATDNLMESGFKVGKCNIVGLIEKKKLDSSWSKAKELKITKAKNNKDWVITFENQDNQDNKILYIFLNAKGDYLAANFKGE